MEKEKVFPASVIPVPAESPLHLRSQCGATGWPWTSGSLDSVVPGASLPPGHAHPGPASAWLVLHHFLQLHIEEGRGERDFPKPFCSAEVVAPCPPSTVLSHTTHGHTPGPSMVQPGLEIIQCLSTCSSQSSPRFLENLHEENESACWVQWCLIGQAAHPTFRASAWPPRTPGLVQRKPSLLHPGPPTCWPLRTDGQDTSSLAPRLPKTVGGKSPSVQEARSQPSIPVQIPTLFSGVLFFFPGKPHYAVGWRREEGHVGREAAEAALVIK